MRAALLGAALLLAGCGGCPDIASSCRGAETVTLSVTRGRASFEDVQLEIDYARDEEFGGPDCGSADARQIRDVMLVLR